MCADEDGDLLIESAVKRIPKVFVVSTLVSATPAQPFIFRNYQVITESSYDTILRPDLYYSVYLSSVY